MEKHEKMIDQVLVHLFNDLLHIEERTLQKHCPGLSMREIHIISAVCEAQEEDNTMTVLPRRCASPPAAARCRPG